MLHNIRIDEGLIVEEEFEGVAPVNEARNAYIMANFQ
jgi:hypothetical protein